MKRVLDMLCLYVLLAASNVFGDGQSRTVFDFDDNEVGKPPAGFTSALTGKGPAVSWLVKALTDAPSGKQVVAQLSEDKTNQRYPVLIQNQINARDVDLSVSFKTVSGVVDASGGLIFRYQDSGNYYVVRANSLEGNVVAYKTEAGKRSNIGTAGWGYSYGVDVEVPHQAWNMLRVVVRGDSFEVYLNSHKLFEVSNDVFPGRGKIGLWTKADAVTYFDDLHVEVLDKL